MTLREKIEQAAREAAFAMVHDTECIWTNSIDDEPVYSEDSISDRIKDSLIAILTDPQVGFKKALEWIANDGDSSWAESICSCYEKYATEEKHDADCTCPCHTSEAKLKELEELSK